MIVYNLHVRSLPHLAQHIKKKTTVSAIIKIRLLYRIVINTIIKNETIQTKFIFLNNYIIII